MLTLLDAEIEPMITIFDLVIEEGKGAVTEVLQNKTKDIGICDNEVRSIHERVTIPGTSKQCREETAFR